MIEVEPVDDCQTAVFTAGVHPDIPFELYRSIEAFNASGAKKLLRSPAHYLLERTEPAAPTINMQMGTVLHAMVLEGTPFDEIAVMVPAEAPSRPSARQIMAARPSEATREAIAWWRGFEDARGDRICLTEPQRDQILGMVEAIDRHAGARDLIARGQAEITLMWVDPEFDIPCKARLDYLQDAGTIVDLKSTINAQRGAFGRQAASLLYHVQAALYLRGAQACGIDAQRIVFVAVENDRPHGVSTLDMPIDAIRAGEYLLRTAMGRYQQCLATQHWPGYSEQIETMPFPRYATRLSADEL